jgi:chromosome partitioning protein
MILTVGNTKGGVGKTTLAVNIAIARALAGSDVLLVDGDDQRTALDFTEIRAGLLGAAGYTASSLYGKALRTQVREFATKYDEIVIDVGGRNTDSLRAALLVSDVLLIPLQPRSVDVWAISQTAELVREASETREARDLPELRVLVLLNSADAQGHDNEEAAAAAREFTGFEVLDTMIGRRKAFPNAISAGRSVLEYMPRDQKAIDELLDVIDAIYTPVGIA